MTTTAHKEVILRGDRAFVRETFEQDIGHIDHVIQDSLSKSSGIHFCPLPLPAFMRKWVNKHYLAHNKQGTTFVFTQVQYLPIKGAMIRPDGRFWLPPARPSSEQQEDIQGYIDKGELLPHPTNKWFPPNESELFYMHTITKEGYVGSEVYTFMIDKATGKPFNQPFPNTYRSDGHICLGEETADLLRDQDNTKPFGTVKATLDMIHESTVNKDLTDMSTLNLLALKKEEDDYVQVAETIYTMVPTTNDIIIQFCTHYGNHTANISI